MDSQYYDDSTGALCFDKAPKSVHADAFIILNDSARVAVGLPRAHFVPTYLLQVPSLHIDVPVRPEVAVMISDVWLRQLEVQHIDGRRRQLRVPRQDAVPLETSRLKVEVRKVCHRFEVELAHPRRVDLHILEPGVLYINA